MIKKKEADYLVRSLKGKGLKWTSPREQVANIFFNTEGHISAEEIYEKLKKNKNSYVGLSTIYRTLKIFCELGFASEVDFGDGRTRFEHKYNHHHHDHLICLACGKSIEFYTPQIERLQEEIVRKHHFRAERHKMEIYGYCRNCR